MCVYIYIKLSCTIAQTVAPFRGWSGLNGLYYYYITPRTFLLFYKTVYYINQTTNLCEIKTNVNSCLI